MPPRPQATLERRKASREPKRRFFLFCEGQNTEPNYFKALEKACKNAFISVETVPPAAVPLTLAQNAAKFLKTHRSRARNSFEEKDQVWTVFDRDEHPNHEEAIALCQSKGVGVARSNPCFEVWLILHETDYQKPDDHHQTQAYFQKLRPEYDPDQGKTPDCADLVQRVEIAEKRAESQLAQRLEEGSPHGPPSTTVGELTKAIREAAQKAKA